MRTPLVSVITPTFNRTARVVARALRSVREQTYQNWEHIVCNDGPFRPEIAALFGSEPRARYLVASKHHGGYGAAVRAEMMGVAKGEYLCFLDDDSQFFPRYLERMVEALVREPAPGQPRARFAICGVFHLGPVGPNAGDPPLYLPGELKVGHIDTLQVMVEAAAMKEVGWVDNSYFADGRTFEALGNRFPFVRIEECLAIHI